MTLTLERCPHTPAHHDAWHCDAYIKPEFTAETMPLYDAAERKAIMAEAHLGHGGAAGSFRSEGCLLCPPEHSFRGAFCEECGVDEASSFANEPCPAL